MNNPDVEKMLIECEFELNKVKSMIDSLGWNSNIVPFLNKYAIIKACGTVEVAYKAIVADHCNRRTKIQVKNYIDKKVRDSSRNPTYSNLCGLLKEFDDSWNNDFKNRVSSHPSGNVIPDSLNSLVSARNDFAHGGNPSITINDVVSHFSMCRIALELMDDIVK
jgi:hypothetical protein